MDIIEFLQKGGVIVYILIFLNMVGVTIMILKIFSLYKFKRDEKDIILDIKNKLTRIDNFIEDSYLTNLIYLATNKLERGLSTIKIIATISPLLGLLGTVIGIFISFDVISKVGLDDPSVFSKGISIALITTVVGLIVAILHYIFYNYFIGVLDRYEMELKNKVLEEI